MSDLTICRKRLIPAETILLKDDEILFRDERIVVTSWRALKKRPDLSHGLSCYYLDEGLKLSKMYHPDESHRWYFDIADYAFNEDGSMLTMTDLLADVAVFPDGSIRVLDLDELALAFDEGLIDASLLKKSLHTLDRLLRELYTDGITRFAAPINKRYDCR